MLKPFNQNIVSAFKDNSSRDSGRMVETILLIAGFAVVAILAVTWIGNAIAGQTYLMARYCIVQSNDIIADTNGATSVTKQKCTGNQVTDLSIRQSSSIMETNGGRF
jgi:hypothetical protein